MGIIQLLLAFLKAFLADRAALAAGNLALRHQLAVLPRSVQRPKLRKRDRIFGSWLSRVGSGWKPALLIVQPDTVVRGHRQGFRLYGRWKSRKKPGRPLVDREIRDLIRRMSRENPVWVVPRIQAALKLLGHDVGKSTIAQYLDRTSKPPSPTWRTFLKNHAAQIAAMDFFTVPTVTFSVLYCFVILRPSDRQILHVNVTTHPSAEWTAPQVVQAFPYDSAPRFLLRDNDFIYGEEFPSRVTHRGIEEVAPAYGSPWQNTYVERGIGSIRRECLDPMILFSENPLRCILDEYVEYDNHARTHPSLDDNSPVPREVEPPENGRGVPTSYLGGLHHRYRRAA